MKKCIVKVPFGSEITLYEGEFYRVARHRLMLFFYFGLICMILVTTMGARRKAAEPELVLGIATIEVMSGLFALLLWKWVSLRYARFRGTEPRVHLGWAVVMMVATAVSMAEVLDPFLLGVPPSDLLEFMLKLFFYITVTEVLTSVMMQYSLTYILADLRKNTVPGAEAPALRDAAA